MPDNVATKVTSDPRQQVVTDKVGAVLVVGAGISGIQSALDLADSGYKVYLVDRCPSIGGAMAQLDKTFPTNDCSMCILAPKLVGAGRHHNIELITNAEVTGFEGDPGNFKVSVLSHARSVDADKCTGCGVCTAVCPVRFKIQPKEIPTEIADFEDGDKVDEIIERYLDYQDPLIQILLDVMEEFNYLPKKVLQYISLKMDIPISHIYRMGTFYNELSLTKKGKYHIKVCLGTSCHVRGARKVLNSIQSYIADKSDDLFSLETTNCLGTCAFGPVMLINDEHHSEMNDKKVNELLGNIFEQEGDTLEPDIDIGPDKPSGELGEVKIGEIAGDLEGGED